MSWRSRSVSAKIRAVSPVLSRFHQRSPGGATTSEAASFSHTPSSIPSDHERRTAGDGSLLNTTLSCSATPPRRITRSICQQSNSSAAHASKNKTKKELRKHGILLLRNTKSENRQKNIEQETTQSSRRRQTISKPQKRSSTLPHAASARSITSKTAEHANNKPDRNLENTIADHAIHQTSQARAERPHTISRTGTRMEKTDSQPETAH